MSRILRVKSLTVTVLELTDECMSDFGGVWHGLCTTDESNQINQRKIWLKINLHLWAGTRKLFFWVEAIMQIIFAFFLSVEDAAENCIFLEQGKQAVDTSVTRCEKRNSNNAAALNTHLQLSWEWISGWGCAAFLWIQEQPPTRIYHLHSYRQYLENNIDTTVRYVSCRSEAPK